MDNNSIVSWIEQEFQPVSLATPRETIFQNLANAVRYWNTCAAFPIVEMYNLNTSGYSPNGNFISGAIQLSTSYKGVYDVYPATQPDWILANYPVWSLLGISVIDNLTSDLIELSEAYKNFRYYCGMDFKWHYAKSDDPTVGPWLYTSNLPAGTTNCAVLGTRRILPNEPIVEEHILNWILYYTKALTKVAEGNTLRKTSAIGIQNDGQMLVTEGKEEVKALQDKLTQEGRWIAFCRRF
jgi:hypothetical protein